MFRSSLVAGCLIALTLAPTAAQQPTQAQRDAVRASCRSDFMANCASVQPGGKEALGCLLRNESKLSAPCRSAVSAIASPSGPAAPAPAAAVAPAPSDASPPAHPVIDAGRRGGADSKFTPGFCSDPENARDVDTGHPDRLRSGQWSQPRRPPWRRLGRYGRCCREGRL